MSSSTSIFAGSSNANKPLVEFKAGKLVKEGTQVKPDKRKGLISVSMQDEFLHFQWKDRTTGSVVDDLIILPGTAKFSRIEKVKSGRVYLLDFPAESKQMFFWMQEVSDAKDEEYAKKINEYITTPPQPQQEQTGPGGLDRNQLLALLSGINPQQRGMQRTSAARTQQPQQRPPQQQTSQPQTPQTPQQQPQQQAPQQRTTQQASIQLSDLQSILANLNVPQTSQAETQPREVLTLGGVLRGDDLARFLQSQPREEVLSRLGPHLPQQPHSPQSVEDITAHVRSPQFQQAVHALDTALYNAVGQELTELIMSFGLPLPPNYNPLHGGAQPFIDAVQNQAQQEQKEESQQNQGSSSSSEQPKDDSKKDNSMDQTD